MAGRLAIRMAGALLVATVVTACGDGSSTSTSSTAPPTTGGPTSSTIPQIAYDKPAPAQAIGSGLVDGTSLDGSAVYVEEEDPRFPEPGCEGQPEPVLFRLPLTGGNKELLGDGQQRLHGRVLHGTGGRVAVVTGCEDSFTDLWVGTETADGHLEGMGRVAVGQVEEGQTLAPRSFSWSSDGSVLLAAANTVGGGGSGRVVQVDPGSGAITPLFDAQVPGGVSQVSQLAGGLYVVAAGGNVSLRDGNGAVQREVPGNGFELGADRRTVIAFGDEVLLLAPEAPRPVRLVLGVAGQKVTAAVPSPDGRALAYDATSQSAGTAIFVLTFEGTKTATVAGPGQLGRAYFSGDGKALVFTRFRVGTGVSADVMVVRFPG